MKKNLLSILLALVLVLGLTVLAAPAVSAEEEVHNHCYCINAAEGAVPETHTCEEGVTWEALTTSTVLVDGGHYYLTNNLAKSITVKTAINVTICLNGHNLFAQKALTVYGGGVVNICNCQNEGRIYSSRDASKTGYALMISSSSASIGTVNLWSGKISGTSNSGTHCRAVEVKGGVFNMYGGQVINGWAGYDATLDTVKFGYGGNVCVYNNAGNVAEFTMYGGTVTGGQASINGGNIYVEGGVFTLNGGTVTGGKNNGVPTEDAPLVGMGGNVFVTSTGDVGTVVINGGTIENGQAYNGGNIAGDGQNVTGGTGKKVDIKLNNGIITGGTATNGGGNIYLHNTTNGSVMHMTGGTITAGKAANGGNVYVDGNNPTTYMTAGIISDGEASGNGGNIYVDAGAGKTWTLRGVTVSGGTAGKTVTESTDAETGEVTTTTSYTGNGGSIYVGSGTLNITTGTVSGGIAKNGGNIYADANGTVNMTDVLLENGISIENGGNIYAVSGSTCTLNSGTISGGTAKSGGNIFTKGTLNIADGEITSGSTSATGGNIRVDGTGSKLTMTGGIVSNGLAADNGGNIYVIDCTQAKIIGGQVLNGESGGAQGGGNLYVTHQKATTTRFLTLSEVTISGGKATAGNGGNIYAKALGKLTMTDVTVENGSATKNGDNVYLQDNINVDITGGTFTATYGGRNYVYDEAKHKSYTQEQIETYGINYAGGDAEKTGNGGNISIYNCGKITETTTTTDETTGEEVTTTTVTATGYVNITGSTIIGGQAENGGAIYVGNGTLTLVGVTARSCGGESGKVLHIAKNGTATVKDSTLINWGIQGSTIVNNGNLILQGNISMPKEYNANEIVVIGLSNTQDILIKCSENANAVMDISELTSVDADVTNVEGIYYGDGVLSVGRSENVNADGDTLNTAGLVANGVNDTNRALIVAYNAAFDLTETDCSYYLVNALIQGVTENGNLTGGGANFDDVTNDGKTSIVYYILNGDLTENAGTIGKDICLNLNGYTVTGATVAQGVKVELMDSANDGYDATKCGSFSGTVNGTVESIVHVNIPGGSRHYVILPNDDGSYSAHRYLAFISHTSLKPAQAALGFKATFRGDEKVRAAATGYGLNMRVNSGNAKEFMKASTEWTAESTTVSLRVQNMLVEGSDAICKAGASAVVYGDAFILFEIGGGNVYATTSEKGVSLKGFIKSLNTDLVANPDNYNATQITAVQTLINNFGAYMEGWEYDAIMAWAESSEEPVPETTEAA